MDHQEGRERHLRDREQEGAQGEAREDPLRQHQAHRAQQVSRAQARPGVAVAVEGRAQRLGERGHQQARQGDGQHGGLPAGQQRQAGRERPRHETAHRHAGLLDGEHQRQAVRRRGANEQVRTRRRDGSVAQTDQQRAAHHRRQPGKAGAGEARRAQRQAELAGPDGAHPRHQGTGDQARGHRAQEHQRREESRQHRCRPAQRWGDQRRQHRQRQGRHGHQRLDRQGRRQRGAGRRGAGHARGRAVVTPAGCCRRGSPCPCARSAGR